jgi:hypothetical protein
MLFLKRKNTKLLMKNSNVIRGFADDSDDTVPGFCVFDIEATEENSYSVLENSLISQEVLAFECQIEVNGQTMGFRCHPYDRDSLGITILPDLILLDDGMIDFNWYYKFWKEVFSESTYVYGVEFSVID